MQKQGESKREGNRKTDREIIRKRKETSDRGRKRLFVRPRTKIPFGAVNNLRTESNFAGENERKERE